MYRIELTYTYVLYVYDTLTCCVPVLSTYVTCMVHTSEVHIRTIRIRQLRTCGRTTESSGPFSGTTSSGV